MGELRIQVCVHYIAEKYRILMYSHPIPVEDAFGMSVSWTQHTESGRPHIYEWILVKCAFTYLIAGVLTHFDRLPQLVFVGKPCFGSFAIGETPGHPRLRDPNHQLVICKFKETSFQRMIGHVQKGMLMEYFLPAASEAKQPANKSGKPILITHSIGQLTTATNQEWVGENKRPLYHLRPPFKAFALCVCRYLRSFRYTTVNVPWRGPQHTTTP